MAIFGSLVIKNEADRYLEACLRHMRPFLDDLFVWDDQSDDASVEIASEYGRVVVRPDDVPAWIEHEGNYRFAAWQEFERTISPEEGDWVLSFDADEFLVCVEDDFSDVRQKLVEATAYADHHGKVGVVLPFPEIFGTKHRDTLMVRTDGLWDTIRGPRLFRYQPNGVWSNKAMGCGSEPTYVSRGTVSTQNLELTMLHLGYADPGDHAERHARYSELFDHGHNNKHIQSIITTPTLVPWDGPTPTWRFD
jgi:hypothetical protein